MSEQHNWKEAAAALNELLRLHSTPIGVKVLPTKEELAAVPKLRTPTTQLNPCQIMAQAIQKGFTIAATAEYVSNLNCCSIHGFREISQEFLDGAFFNGVWFANAQAACAHQTSLHTLPQNPQGGIVYSPLRSARIEPDVCVLLVNPAQAFILFSGLIEGDYKKLDFEFVGESSCSAGWIRTLVTGKPSLTPPCYAELRFGGFPEGELIAALTPAQLATAIQGMMRLASVGLRYPAPSYAADNDPIAGLAASYDPKTLGR
ncbi:DUF169 domain-containing protein [Ruminococcaceae bacterium OttesenSCG-928-O06]|nr:DUF169 domain-containing protein [Ruminococcaceae bacterium OttesenSCG-928-O06]